MHQQPQTRLAAAADVSTLLHDAVEGYCEVVTVSAACDRWRTSAPEIVPVTVMVKGATLYASECVQVCASVGCVRRTCTVHTLPPARSRASSTSTDLPAVCRARAAARPDMPAPMTITSYVSEEPSWLALTL
jgi:hypothetical protein